MAGAAYLVWRGARRRAEVVASLREGVELSKVNTKAVEENTAAIRDLIKTLEARER